MIYIYIYIYSIFHILTIVFPDTCNVKYLCIFCGSWASEASPTPGCSINISRDIYVYVIAWAGVIFGIYFKSCRYSGG